MNKFGCVGGVGLHVGRSKKRVMISTLKDFRPKKTSGELYYHVLYFSNVYLFLKPIIFDDFSNRIPDNS